MAAPGSGIGAIDVSIQPKDVQVSFGAITRMGKDQALIELEEQKVSGQAPKSSFQECVDHVVERPSGVVQELPDCDAETYFGRTLNREDGADDAAIRVLLERNLVSVSFPVSLKQSLMTYRWCSARSSFALTPRNMWGLSSIGTVMRDKRAEVRNSSHHFPRSPSLVGPSVRCPPVETLIDYERDVQALGSLNRPGSDGDSGYWIPTSC